MRASAHGADLTLSTAVSGLTRSVLELDADQHGPGMLLVLTEIDDDEGAVEAGILLGVPELRRLRDAIDQHLARR